MARSAALDVAVTLVEHPAAVRQASCSPLPGGMGLLLQVATRAPGALRSAQAMTGRSPEALQAAAGFYIEQILFHPQADYYRTLGASSGAPRSELRRNMALLIKWLHPDGREQRGLRSDLDRGIFIHRVTQAWEQLKTEEGRAAYDRTLSEKVTERKRWRSRRRRLSDKAARAEQRRRSSTVNRVKKVASAASSWFISRARTCCVACLRICGCVHEPAPFPPAAAASRTCCRSAFGCFPQSAAFRCHCRRRPGLSPGSC